MKSSINFQPVKSTSESHNLRLRDFDYVRKDLKEYNYSTHSSDFKNQPQRITELKKIIKEKTGRTVQEKTVILKEGVFLIKPEHTNEQLFDTAKKFGIEFNLKVVELHIHRDEGHWKIENEVKVWKPNLHAHLVIENIDRNTGKSLGWKRDDMVKIQDFFAQELKMERGKSSSKKHVDSKIWKIEKEIESKKGDLKHLIDVLDTKIENIEISNSTEINNVRNEINTHYRNLASNFIKSNQLDKKFNEYAQKEKKEVVEAIIAAQNKFDKLTEKKKEISVIKEKYKAEEIEIKPKSKGFKM
jgi:hypothetical protein